MFSANSSFETILACATRLYEQKKTDDNCQTFLGEYVHRWQKWASAGLNNIGHIRQNYWPNKTPHYGGAELHNFGQY